MQSCLDISQLWSSNMQFGCETQLNEFQQSLNGLLLINTLITAAFRIFVGMSQAFNRLHYCERFKLLYKRNLPAEILRLTINFNSRIDNIRISCWHGAMSRYFTAMINVKQSAVMCSRLIICCRPI